MPPTVLIALALGSILLGLATPAEAAAMGAFGAIVLSIAYRKFTVPGFFDWLIKTLEITVLIKFLVAASNFFGAEFSNLGTPKMLIQALLELDMLPYLVLMLIMGLIFCFAQRVLWLPRVLVGG
jgi:TRAP-type mannitol/chloroaromatic compound transport system permease large subunit